MAEIRNFRVRENALELFAQSGLHLFLIQKNPVLRQSAGLDVTVDQQHSMSRFGELARSVDAGGARADNGHEMLLRHVFLLKPSIANFSRSFERDLMERTGKKKAGKVLLQLSFTFEF